MKKFSAAVVISLCTSAVCAQAPSNDRPYFYFGDWPSGLTTLTPAQASVIIVAGIFEDPHSAQAVAALARDKIEGEINAGRPKRMGLMSEFPVNSPLLIRFPDLLSFDPEVC